MHERSTQLVLGSLEEGAKGAKGIIILASNEVNDRTLFLNGLTQNILVLYELFESLGYTAYLLQAVTGAAAAGGSDGKKSFLSEYRPITTEAIVKQGMPVTIFLEVGMSIDAMTRGYLRSCGCRMAKLYLGNILNIDVETIQNHPSFFFNHHLVGDIDEIWTSPHYAQHLDYAAILNRTPVDRARIVPYVWSPRFLEEYGRIRWTPPRNGSAVDLVVMDPNISFQKYAFYPLLLAEAYHRAHPEWTGRVYVYNGDRLKLSANALNRFLPSLRLYRAGRVALLGRHTLHEILAGHPSACFLTHQWNNAYNYMLLETMYCDYPVVHNSDGWMTYGYSYSIDRWSDAVETVHRAVTGHRENLAVYRAHTANLVWNHSIHCPAIRERWRAILLGPQATT